MEIWKNDVQNFDYISIWALEFLYFKIIKFSSIDEYYKELANVVDKRIDMYMPVLSMTLQNSDGSFIAEMLFKEFNFEMISYMDTMKKFLTTGK